MTSGRLHCIAAVLKAAKQSRHRVGDACDSVSSVLALNPNYGVVVKGHSPLRKMRIKAPGLTTGKSSGYRLIYATLRVDEVQHFVLLALYFKSDRDDLDATTYRELRGRAAAILDHVFDHDWTDIDSD